jgi:monosaccharide-transporting ATPase
MQGLVLGMDVKENLTLAILKWISNLLGWVRGDKQHDLANDYVKQLDIQTPGLWQTVRNLSGGNQQKIVIAKWLCMNPKVLILDEPTRGIDVGAHAEIINIMKRLCQQGMALLVISSELAEVVDYSHRIIVLRDRKKIAELERDQISENAIMQAIAEN